LVCDGTTNCPDGHDEAYCCSHDDFQCSNLVCISQSLTCDGWEHCADGEDEKSELCSVHSSRRTPSGSDKKVFIVILVVLVLLIFFIVYVLQICRSKIADTIREPKEDQASAPLSPGGINSLRVSKITSVADAVRLTTLSRTSMTRSMNSYDRNNITGASSSTTNGSSLIGYPQNPPPSPATTSTIHHSHPYPYKHYKVINQAPPTTPCSTDVCESDSNYTPISIKSSKKSAESYNGNIYMSSIGAESTYNKSF
jgi:low density lipoprotein receptor-related protein 5/6